MAASTKPTSPWVSSYKDKTDDWVRARLEHLEGKEKISKAGSMPRRKEIRELRVELLGRRKAAEGDTGALNGTAAPVPASSVPQLMPTGRAMRT